MMPRRPRRDDVKFATGWTDDMFMASAVLSRVGSETPTHGVGASAGC